MLARTARTATPEDVILGCLLDKADLVYPMELAEYVASALRDAGLLRDAQDDEA